MSRDLLQGVCPLTVGHPVMTQRWERLSFLHWSYEPHDVQRLLPRGLAVDTFDQRAWVGLVPFFMRVRPPGLSSPPWLGRFCETNVRTYVRDDEGRPGIWFFSLDAARLPAVLAGRAGFGLPYCWSGMQLEATPARVRYRCRRRWPSGSAAESTVVVRPGQPIRPEDVTHLEHFLTARWRLFSQLTPNILLCVEAQHPRWPLRSAVVDRCQDALVTAAGLPPPAGSPLVHYSDGVDVRIGRPRVVRAATRDGPGP